LATKKHFRTKTRAKNVNEIDYRKFTNGDPNLAANSEHGELLQTVTEAVAKLNRLNPQQATNLLG